MSLGISSGSHRVSRRFTTFLTMDGKQCEAMNRQALSETAFESEREQKGSE